MIQLPGLAGTLRYAGPVHLAHWLGLPKNYCYSIQTAFPCESSDTCGQHTLCNPCSEASDVLGRAWHLGTSAMAIYELVSNTTNNPAARYHPFRNLFTHQRNGFSCPKAMTMATLRQDMAANRHRPIKPNNPSHPPLDL